MNVKNKIQSGREALPAPAEEKSGSTNGGASPYDVAKMLGDTIETVERHYTPFVKELRQRVRNILESGIGLEEMSANATEAGKRLN
jgi:hypothetical protein